MKTDSFPLNGFKHDPLPEHPMEHLKKLGEVCQMDVRQGFFTIMDPKHPGIFRKRGLEDFHHAAESIRLHAGVPESIRDHFQTARNLIIYSWFYYPFNISAQLSAYTSVEFALRTKTNDRKTKFAVLLKRAVDNGWISDRGVSIARRRKQAIRRMNQGMPPDFQTPEPPMVREYSDTLAKVIPSLRNSLAHGTTMLHEQGALHVRICAELINQLFSSPSNAGHV